MDTVPKNKHQRSHIDKSETKKQLMILFASSRKNMTMAVLNESEWSWDVT